MFVTVAITICLTAGFAERYGELSIVCSTRSPFLQERAVISYTSWSINPDIVVHVSSHKEQITGPEDIATRSLGISTLITGFEIVGTVD